MSLEPNEHKVAGMALAHTPKTWSEPSDPIREMIVARAALHLAALIMLGELKIPDWVQSTLPKSLTEQEIVDYCTSRIRMEMHAQWDENNSKRER